MQRFFHMMLLYREKMRKELQQHYDSKLQQSNDDAWPKHYLNDISQQRFGNLVALYPTGERDKKRYVIWHCRCDCGKEVDISRNKLLYTKVVSCGCQKQKHNQELKTFLTHTSGTSVDYLKSKKTPANNTTGRKGIYLVDGHYRAKIVFQHHQYYLGTYDTLEEAAAVRAEAERVLFDGFVSFYEKWEKKAKEDPKWAENNPIRVNIGKLRGELFVELLPKMED